MGDLPALGVPNDSMQSCFCLPYSMCLRVALLGQKPRDDAEAFVGQLPAVHVGKCAAWRRLARMGPLMSSGLVSGYRCPDKRLSDDELRSPNGIHLIA